MKKLLIVCSLFVSSLVWAQSTSSVTATVQDLSGQLFNNGTCLINFVPNPRTPNVSQYNVNGATFNLQPACSINNVGTLSATVTRNDLIAPAGSSWAFTVSPNATSQSYVLVATISAGSVDLTTQFAGVITSNISVTASQVFPRAYKDSELVLTPNPGQSYWDVTLNSLKIWDGSVWNQIVPLSNSSNPTFNNLTLNGTLTVNGTGGINAGTNPVTAGAGTFTSLSATDGSNLFGSAFTAVGDSITACFGIVTQSNCYVNRIATAKVWTATNQGNSGDGIADMSSRVFGDTFSTSSVSTLLCCVNDMRLAGINGTSATQDTWQRNVLGVVADMALPEANKIYGDGSGVTYGGTWGAPGIPTILGSHVKQATANSSTATMSIYGTTVYVVSLWQLTDTSTYKITIDGIDQSININGTVGTTITTSTGGFTSNNGSTFGPYAFRFSGLTETTHTVVLTCISCSSVNPVYFLFAGSSTGAQTRTGPFVYLGNTLRFTTAGYVASGGSDAFVDQFNQRLKETATELDSDGLHVSYIDVGGYYTPNGTNTQADGVHPTDAGDGIIASAFENDMAGYQTPRVVAGSQWFRNISPCTYNGIFSVGGCPTGAIAGALGAVQTPTKGTLYLGSDGSGIARNGATVEWTWASGTPVIQFNGTTSAFPAFKFTGTPAKVTVRAADDSGDAALEALSLVINGGTALTGQLGTGSNVMTDKSVTLTLKKGSGGGTYTSASTTYVVMDATNLCYTVTIPTGYKLSVQAQGVGNTATAVAQFQVAITDNAACSTANAGILIEGAFAAVSTAVNTGWSLGWVISGDGAAHNIALQYKTSNAADSAQIGNASATLLPTMVFTLAPSN